MKKILFLLLLISVVSPVAAQRWTVWYGINYTNEIKNGPLNQWRIANGGVDYTIPVSRWDYTAGVGFNTKGSSHRVNYVQLEGNAGYRFIDTPYGFRVSALAGPFFGIRVADDRYELNVSFSANQDVEFIESAKNGTNKFKVNATINPDGKISLFKMIKIVE